MATLLSGCATPSYREEFFKDGELTHRITKWENSTFFAGKSLYLRIEYDDELKSPTIRLGYGHSISGRVFKGQRQFYNYGLKGVKLWGSLDQAYTTYECVPAATQKDNEHGRISNTGTTEPGPPAEKK